VSIKPRGSRGSATRRNILIDHSVDIPPKACAGDARCSGEGRKYRVGRHEDALTKRAQLPDRDAIPGDDERSPLVQLAHDSTAVVAELALGDSMRSSHCSTIRPLRSHDAYGGTRRETRVCPQWVVHELYDGAFKSQRGEKNVPRVDGLQFQVLECDQEDARQAGEIRAHLASKGTPIGPYDVLIAGQAKARKLTLVTHNTTEFQRVPGLKVEDWKGAPASPR
jgi:tRNA(fMet)-specific endonuclease VapC